jgi:hypothetical protein
MRDGRLGPLIAGAAEEPGALVPDSSWSACWMINPGAEPTDLLDRIHELAGTTVRLPAPGK